MASCKTYIANTIYLIGFPVIMVATDKPSADVRIAEFFILMFPPQGEVTLTRRRFVYHNLPDSVLSDQELLDATLVTVQAELDQAVDVVRQQLAPDQTTMLPYYLRFTPEELGWGTLPFTTV